MSNRHFHADALAEDAFLKISMAARSAIMTDESCGMKHTSTSSTFKDLTAVMCFDLPVLVLRSDAGTTRSRRGLPGLQGRL